MRKILYSIIILLIIIIVFLITYKLYQRKSEASTTIIINSELAFDYNFENVYVISADYKDEGILLNLFIGGTLVPKLILDGEERTYSLNNISNNIYTVLINFNNLKNSTYKIYINTDKKHDLINNLDTLNKLVKGKVGNKLVTFDYTNNIMSFKTEDFNYEYDILIDPGHGGIDVGTSNNTMNESELNLIVSLYEKKRFEELGLKVLLSRNDEKDGLMMGESSWNRAKNRGYAIGYYGVTSKVVYSNHHNASNTISDSGFEIITSNELETDFENKILKGIISIEPSNLINHLFNIYSRDIETGIIYDKSDSQIYTYQDYYATIRLPLKLYNVKTVTYEGCYMSNSDNFYWYYTLENYKKISEIKIKYYVELLGKTYNSPKN